MTYIGLMMMLVLSMVVGLAAGIYVFGDYPNLSYDRAVRGIRRNYKFVIALVLILCMIMVENALNPYLIPYIPDRTQAISDFSLDGELVMFIQGFRNQPTDLFLITIYIYFYSYMLFFTPFLYLVRDDRVRLKQYTIAMCIAYGILLPLYIFVPVQTTGYSHLVNAYPVLYSNPELMEFVRMFDSLDNCFPSGHVAVPVLTALLLFPTRNNPDYRRFAHFSMTVSILVCIAVLYLGIHWEIDVIAGIGLAVFSVLLVRNRAFRRLLSRGVGRVAGKR